MVADRPTQHWILGFEGIKNGALGRRPRNLQFHLAIEVRQMPQMGREHDSDHGKVCTSTERTAGRSRTIGVQVSPLSLEAYTCPPLVPK